MDIIAGVETPQTIVSAARTLTDLHKGTVIVDRGGHLTVAGMLQGTLDVLPGASARIVGVEQGTVHVGREATLDVNGMIQGTVGIEAGGSMRVHPAGQVQGSIANQGSIENHGSRGGPVSGEGSLIDMPGSRVVQPRIKDGVHFYDW
jgi:hypothetical protein